MAEYEGGSAYLQFLPSTRGFAARAKRELGGLNLSAEVEIELNDRAYAGLQRALRSLPVTVLTADSSPADREVDALRQRIAALSQQTVGVDLTGDQARAEIAAISADLDRLAEQSPELAVRVDAGTAHAALDGVGQHADRLDGRRIRARVDVDVIGAVTSLASLALRINAFATRSYSFRVDVDTVGAVTSVLRLVATVGLLGGGAGIVGGLAGALAGVGAAGAVAAAGVIPAVLAFRGVFDAVKALSAQQQTAGVDAAAAAQKQAAAAAAVASATERLGAASRNAGRARAEASRAVAEADKRQRMAAAELEREQQSCTRAWEAGRRSLQDLQDQLDGTVLDQRQASFDLADAQAALAEAQATGNADEIARAQLGVDKQVESMDRLAKAAERAQADNTAAQAAGIAGSEQMVAARGRVTSAEGQLAEATAAVTRAREDGAQRVADADAQVIEAQRALTQALTQTGDTGSSAAQKVEQAFADLSPEAAAFARYLFGLKPLLDELSGTAASRFFPPLRDGLDTLITKAPLANTIVGQLAGAMGVGLGGVLTQLASPYWTSFFELLGSSSTTLIPRLFDSLMTLAAAGSELLRVLLPLAPAGFNLLDQFAGLLVVLAPFIAQLLGGLIPAASSFLTALEPLGPVLAALSPILAVLGEAFAIVLVTVLQALAPILVALTPLIVEFATVWATGLADALTTATPLLVTIAQFLSDNAGTIVWLTGVIGGLVAGFQPLLWALGLFVTWLHGFIILRIAGAALAYFGLQGTWLATVVTRLLSPISLLRMALPFIGRAIMFVGRMVLGALGPLGILLTILGFLYTSNEEFRNAVNMVFAVLGQLVGLLVSSLMPAFNQIIGAIAPLIPLLLDALMPVVTLLAGVFVDLIATVLPPVVGFIVGQLIPIIVQLAKIFATVLVWVITNVVVPAIEMLAWFITNVVAPVILWLYQNIVKPAFERIGNFIAWVWANIIKPALDFMIWLLVNVLGPTINWLWQNIVKPAFQTIGNIISAVWENVIRPAFAALSGGLDGLGAGFDSTVAWIGDIWNGLRNLLAVPINFLIGTVFNNGIRKAWNLVADLLPGVDPIGELPLIPEYAKGGPVLGDTVLRAGEAGPEYVLSAPAVRAMGGLGVVDELHRDLVTGRGRDRAEIGGPLSNFDGGSGSVGGNAGGVWQRLWGIVRGEFPAARLTSSVRPGDRGFHGQGKAIDIAGPTPGNAAFMKTVNRWIATAYPTSSETIYTPGINLKAGRAHTYNPATRADHFDHVHWAMANGTIGEASGTGRAYNWFEQQVANLIDGATNPVIDAIPFRAPPKFLGIPRDAAITVRDNIKSFLVGEGQREDAVSAGAGGNGGAGVARWRGLVQQALGMMGQSPALADKTLRRMNQESGGNPRAINLWDSNAKKGTPSKGLMQVIDPTFRSYRDSRASNDIWDPLANVLASMKYALSRYGSLPRAYDRAGGYDSGGIGRGVGWMWKGTGLDERVLPPVETQSYDTLTRLSQQLEAGRAAVPTSVSAAQYAAAIAGAGPRGGDGAAAGDTFYITAREEHSEARVAREVQRQRDQARRTT